MINPIWKAVAERMGYPDVTTEEEFWRRFIADAEKVFPPSDSELVEELVRSSGPLRGEE